MSPAAVNCRYILFLLTEVSNYKLVDSLTQFSQFPSSCRNLNIKICMIACLSHQNQSAFCSII